MKADMGAKSPIEIEILQTQLAKEQAQLEKEQLQIKLLKIATTVVNNE